MANIRKMQMVCTNCGNVRYLYLDENLPVMRRTAIQSLLCKKCNRKRKHMEKGVYSEEKVQEMRKDLYLTYAEQLDIDCSEIIINHAHSAKNIYIKCTLKNGLYFIFRHSGDAAEWILMNHLAEDESKADIARRIGATLKRHIQTFDGLSFSSTFLILNGKYCDEPTGYCHLKGCYLSDTDQKDRKCLFKQCTSFEEI